TRGSIKHHFASDAVVGSALGWYFGRQVYRAHHDSELAGGVCGNFLEEQTESPRDPKKMGSPHVPLDSWVYPALNRLVALGYIQTAYLGMRPWTRMECARLLEEAGEQTPSDDNENGNGGRIYEALNDEFEEEIGRLNGAKNLGVCLDSVYMRIMEIS